MFMCVCVSYAFHWNLHKIIRERERARELPTRTAPKKVVEPRQLLFLLLDCVVVVVVVPGLLRPSLADSSTPRVHPNPNPSIPRSAQKMPKLSLHFPVFASEVLKIDASGSLHMPQSNLLGNPTPIPPSHISTILAICHAHYFSAFPQLSVNISGIFGLKMQMHRQKIVHSLQIRVAPWAERYSSA